MSSSPGPISTGDGSGPYSAEELLPLVYEELRKLADARLAGEHAPQTLQATALVHEAYLRLIGPKPPDDAALEAALAKASSARGVNMLGAATPAIAAVCLIGLLGMARRRRGGVQ